MPGALTPNEVSIRVYPLTLTACRVRCERSLKKEKIQRTQLFNLCFPLHMFFCNYINLLYCGINKSLLLLLTIYFFEIFLQYQELPLGENEQLEELQFLKYTRDLHLEDYFLLVHRMMTCCHL